MVAAVSAFSQAMAHFYSDHVGRQFPTAPAEKEKRQYADAGIVQIAYDQGTSLTEAAVDHMVGFSKTMVEPVTRFAPSVCVRTVLESSAVATWLMEPEIGLEQRIKRSFAFRFGAGYKSRRSFCKRGSQTRSTCSSTERGWASFSLRPNASASK